MNCRFSREILALYVEDDLPTSSAVANVESHILGCPECRKYCEGVRNSQAFIKSRFRPAHRESVNQDIFTSVRHGVMAQIDEAQQTMGWALRLERFLMLGFRKQRYAVAGFAFLAVVSVSLLGQIGQSGQRNVGPAAVFAGKNALLRPTGYREWVFVGSSVGPGYAPEQSSTSYHNVYMNPDAYREYSHSGKFPEGTVMVLEMLSAESKSEPGLQGSYAKDFMGLEVSVKDSRFDGGWGFYDFTEAAGKLKGQAEPVPQSAGCLSCHREKAATDHVFTQFYPALRGMGPGTI